MFIVAISIAFCAAFFSVKGIGLLFAGSFISVIIMASTLEAGKLVAASFLYRKWSHLARWLKIYLISAVILLMGITSLGIFGFLTDAYEQTKTSVDLYKSTIERLQGERDIIQDELASIKKIRDMTRDRQGSTIDNYKSIYDNFVSQQQSRITQLNSNIKGLDEALDVLQSQPGGIFSSKSKKIEALKVEQKPIREKIRAQLDEIDSMIAEQYSIFMKKVDGITEEKKGVSMIDDKVLYSRLADIENEILTSKVKISETDIGSFKFIARAFDVDTDTAVKWFTLIIVIVFDPLAVSLIIGYNAMLGTSSSMGKSIPDRETPSGSASRLPAAITRARKFIQGTADINIISDLVKDRKKSNARLRPEN